MTHGSSVVLGLSLLASGFLTVAASPTPPKPDLRCAILTVEKLPTQAVFLRVKVHLEVKNFGAGNSESFVSRLSYKKGSGAWTVHQEFPSPFTPPGGGAIWNPQIDLPESGTYTFKVEVDANHKVAESSEGNNTKTVSKVLAGGTPDLTPTNLDAVITRVTSNGAVYTKVEWDVENIGDGKAAGSFVTVIKVSKNNGSFVELARFSRSNLQAGGTFHFVKTSSFTSVTRLKFRIETDATNAIGERSNSNNSADSVVLQP
jgi:hypothetical protein